MRVRDVRQAVEPENLARKLKTIKSYLHSKVHRGPITITRTDSYKGHNIQIRTTYEIRVDGRQIHGHLHVAKDGRVHYHPLPNYSSGSAVELVRQIIDSFPDEFPNPERGVSRRRKAGPQSPRKKRR